MPERLQNTRPMMSALRGFQSDHTCEKIRKEIRQLDSAQALPKCDLPAAIYSMNLKNISSLYRNQRHSLLR